jgi:hypothetical protein
MNAAVSNTVSQGILAKLLATENIQVHVGNYKTAFFDVKNRILGLPSWNVESKQVSDLLIGHEVGHALYTPSDSIEKFKAAWPHIPFSILNVVEDVRIERLIQKRYPGLVSSFNKGYAEFLDRDFFKIAGKDVNELGFADRLNIKAKLRHLIDVKFSADEAAIYDRCQKAETIDEVVGIVLDIYQMVKVERKPKVKLPSFGSGSGSDPDEDDDDGDPTDQVEILAPDPDEEDEEETPESDPTPPEPKPETPPKEDEDDSDDSDDDEDGDEEEDDEDGDEDDDDSVFPQHDTKTFENDEDYDDGETKKKGGEDDEEEDDSDSDDLNEDSSKGSNTTENLDDPDLPPYKSIEDELTSSTLDSLTEKLSELHTNFGKNRPIIMPSKHHIDTCVTGWKKVMKSRMENENYERRFVGNETFAADWAIFKKTTKKNIQNLINDFERKKAAYQYSRSLQSDSGDIDLNRLHSYKYDDQIFNTITKLADAKSHGMMFFIDYSDSMRPDIFHVLEHTLNLVMFCKAVAIPFQVFGFTNQLSELSDNDVLSNQVNLSLVNIFELLSSEMDSKSFELACRHMRAQIVMDIGVSFLGSKWETMAGTPLNETLIVAHELVARFRRKHHIQRMNVLVLSDGEGQGLRFGYNRDQSECIKAPTGVQTRYSSYLGGKEILLTQGDTNRNYAVLVQSLRENLGCTMIGFFITRQRNSMKKAAITAIQYSREHGATDDKRVDWELALALAEKELKSMRKNKCMFIHAGFNFDCYFMIDARDTKIEEDKAFTTREDFTEAEMTASLQNKLAKEFTKYTSDKKSNRIILSKFAEIIA